MDSNDGSSATSQLPILRAANHQVAGHGYDGATLGSSVDGLGRFYKPLQDGERGDREVDFYNKLEADHSVSSRVRSFFPKYFGTISIEGPKNTQAVRHGIMEDVGHSFRQPSIIDLKIGRKTWYPEATKTSIEKNKVKDQETTSAALGFRVSGMQVYDASQNSTFKADKTWARNLSASEAIVTLRRYVSSNPYNETGPDGAFAASVYGGPNGVIAQLEVLKDWFTTQTSYHFTSSSVLLIYEGDLMSDGKPHNPGSSRSVTIKLIDFAHTISGKSSIDENCLDGLQSLIGLLSGIVESQSGS